MGICPAPRRNEAHEKHWPVGYPSGQRGQTVNLLAYAFTGSNPVPTTIFRPTENPADSYCPNYALKNSDSPAWPGYHSRNLTIHFRRR
jgi:hypothetical protein